MPELPERPDIDQLRRQARELYRAAMAGEPDARARIRNVCDRVALSAAQLAVAREHGYPSWPALRAEVRRRRALLVTPVPGGWLDPRYSFGGGTAITTAEGVISPEVLIVGPGHAELHASGLLHPPEPSEPGPLHSPHGEWPDLHDLTAMDDKDAAYTLSFGSGSLHFARPGEAQRPNDVSYRVDPVPPADASWIDVRAQNGPATRLAPSPRGTVRVGDVTAVPADAAAARGLEELAYRLLELRHSNPFLDLSGQRAAVLARAAEIQRSAELDSATELAGQLAGQLTGQLARLCDRLTNEHVADGLPDGLPAWYRFLDALTQADGPERHLDLAAALPRVGGLAVQLDHFVSRPDAWHLYLRAMPTWWGRSEDGNRKWPLVSVEAGDDRGGRYLSVFGGSTGHRDYEAVRLKLVPRLDPLARSLKLTFSAGATGVAVDLDPTFAAK